MAKQTDRFPVACFAPALTDAALAKYEALINGLGSDMGEVKDAMQTCLKCVKAWWDLPESKRGDKERFIVKHKDKEIEVAVTPLEKAHVSELDSVTPWMRELDTLSNKTDTGVFDSLPAGELRNAAFHLLWHCKEITLDREPMTLDKLPA